MPEIDRWFDLGDATVVNENGVEWMRPKEGNGEKRRRGERKTVVE